MNVQGGTAENAVRNYRLFIDGDHAASESGRVIERHNPATGALVATWPAGTAKDAERAIAAARAAFADRRWCGLSVAERSAVLFAVADRIRDNAAELARIESLESGKTLAQATDEVLWAADIWRYAAGQARAQHGDSHGNLGDGKLALVLREPAGVVGMITPWNFPLVILSQKLPFALAAGCSVVIKPSELTSGTTLIVASYLSDAGLPAGVFNVVTGYGKDVGAVLSAHPAVDVITFTGSTATGQAIIAAAAPTMKKTVLELGGKSPNIVFADADIDAAVDAAIKGVVLNQGAECCAGSRVLVQYSILEDFKARLLEKVRRVTVGDPLSPDSTIGAIVNETQFEKIKAYIAKGRAQNTLLCGGEPVAGLPGYFLQPTIFCDVRPGDAIATDEIFGPVMALIGFDTPEEAAIIANDTAYGLASGIWTSSVDNAIWMARAIRAGIVWVNTYLDLPTEVPIGGIKQSGYGRENGRFAIEEFQVLKTVVIQDSRAYGKYLG
ncbi:aldehyde dehydrogenase family protein [Shinella pollutisoli]|uniref:Aldehyde dehydrogenase family protein n=1 Tax=Shinella pollutisoli TaxID=2250594 RepID=A0ABV7DKL3_9HYPH|nr:aldehyde dehydrogenase family protein [Shinella pollutisoli]